MKLVSKAISLTLPYVPKPIMGYFAKAYIAGERLEDAVKTIKTLMGQGASATLDVLGEEVVHKEQALYAVDLYKQVLQRINEEKLDAGVSLKPTHMGLHIDKEFCYNNIREIVKTAKVFKRFVRIDMEDHTTTSDTLNMYIRLQEEFDNVGTVIQAYLRRTVNDVNKLLPVQPNLRVCKGIYVEPYSKAYKDRDVINQNFAYILEKLLRNGGFVGIATHDERVVWEALRIIDKYKIPKTQYEFQMLLGVRPELRNVLLNDGQRLRVYVPFGAEWLQYSTRRLKENPDIVGYVTKSLFAKAVGKQV